MGYYCDLVDFVKARVSQEDFKEFEQRLDTASLEAENYAYSEGYDNGYQDGFEFAQKVVNKF